MDHDKYDKISISSDALEYGFTSRGIKGALAKLIQFKLYDEAQNIYNLALGTFMGDGTVDFTTVSKNGDRDKILATIATSAYMFSGAYPERKIFLTGDVPAKTRLYQMAINHGFQELSETFDVLGLVLSKKEKRYISYPFEKGKNYDAFIFIRKQDVGEAD